MLTVRAVTLLLTVTAAGTHCDLQLGCRKKYSRYLLHFILHRRRYVNRHLLSVYCGKESFASASDSDCDKGLCRSSMTMVVAVVMMIMTTVR
jgi:hypothetical protein